MTPKTIDPDGRSTIASAEAQAALAAGDTSRAGERYAAAGNMLEADVAEARTEADEHLARFLAATQYYKGGDYKKALRLAKKVKEKFLPDGPASLLPAFLRDAEERVSRDYRPRIAQKMRSLIAAKDYDGIIRLLQEDPYIMPPGALAFMRAFACDGLGKYRLASLFHADAIARTPGDNGLAFAATATPMALLAEGRVKDAWDYVSHLIKAIPSASTYYAASLICFARAMEHDSGETRLELLRAQQEFLEKGRVCHAGMRPSDKTFQDVTSFARDVAGAGIMGLSRSGSLQEALAFCREAMTAAPLSPIPFVARGIATYPSEEAIADFERAITLGADTFHPYNYLAHAALLRLDCVLAKRYCMEALTRVPSSRSDVLSELFGWLAMCEAELGGDDGEIAARFEKAIELNPANEIAADNYGIFIRVRDSRAPGSTKGASRIPQPRHAMIPAEAMTNFNGYKLDLARVRQSSQRARNDWLASCSL